MRKNYTKYKLAESLNTKLGYSKEESKEFIEIFFKSIINNINNQGTIKISRLTTFNLVKKKQRMGRNPKTGEEAVISKRKVISCKFSKYMKNKINKEN